MRTEKDIALERVEIGKGIWFDVSILSIKQRLTHKLLIYTKDKMSALIIIAMNLNILAMVLLIASQKKK